MGHRLPGRGLDWLASPCLVTLSLCAPPLPQPPAEPPDLASYPPPSKKPSYVDMYVPKKHRVEKAK